MPGTILVVGSTARDRFHHRNGEVEEHPGGNGLLTARWFSTLGHDVTLATVHGTDLTPPDGLDTAPTTTLDGPGSTCDIPLDHPDDWDYTPRTGDTLPAIPDEHYDIGIVTGGHPGYADLLPRIDADHRAYDPDGTVNHYDDSERFEAALKAADTFRVNHHEAAAAEELTGNPIETFPDTYDLDTVLVTDAEQVARHDPDRTMTYDVPQVEDVAETTGAGCAFTAAYLDQRLADRSYEEAVETGIEHAQEAIRTIGGFPHDDPG